MRVLERIKVAEYKSMTSYDFPQHALELGFTRKLESAKQTTIVNGQAISLNKHLRSDEWEIIEEGWLTPDVMVTPKGRVLALTLLGRKALANAR